MKGMFLFLALVAFVAADKLAQTADNFNWERQKDILQLFRFVNQQSPFKKFVDIGKTYPVQNEELYTKPEVVEEFFSLSVDELLPRGVVFNLMNDEHLQYAIALYNMLYCAKDYETFLNVAIWARQNVNQGLFVYSLSVALVYRPDTKDYLLPPIYEIFPQYFFNSHVIQKVQDYKQQLFLPYPFPQRYQKGSYMVTANYTSSLLYVNQEQSLAYFTEDLGFNAFNYYLYVYCPFWLKEESIPICRELSASTLVLSQILAKYYMERLTNGLGDIEPLNFHPPYTHETGFYPLLKYPNGLDFLVRPHGGETSGPVYLKRTIQNYNYTQSGTFLLDYGRRVRDAIDLGYVINTKGEKIEMNGTDGLYLLMNILIGNQLSINPRFYGSVTKYALYVYGNSFIPLDSRGILPSALELPETTARDPSYYRFCATMYEYLERYLMYQPQYTYKDLELPGVTIQDFEISRLITYYDYFYADISNALYISEKEFIDDSVRVFVRQQRLNHQSFTYKLDLKSTKTEEVVIKVFIGPKYDEFNNVIHMHKETAKFALLDIFPYMMQVGENTIQRNSKEFLGYFPELPSFKDIYNKLSSTQSLEQILQQIKNPFLGMPSRFMLPKGTPEGQVYQLYVFVSPASTTSILYPFDKFAKPHAYRVPNAYLTDVTVYFKELSQTENYTI